MNPEQRPPMAAPIRPQVRPPSANVRPLGPTMPATRPPMNAVPGAAGQAAFSPATAPRPVLAQPLRPQMQPSLHPPPPRPANDIARPPAPPAVNNLVAPMANMHLQQQQKQQQQQLPLQQQQQQLQQQPRPAMPIGSPSLPATNVPPAQRSTASRPKRVYAVNPEVAAATMPSPNTAGMSGGSTPPWPHGLPPGRPAAPSTPAQHHSPSAAAGVGYTQGPYTNTSQQLPPELRPPQQPRPRIDPDQMPAPVQVREQDAMVFGDKFFGTIERERIPLATTNFIGLDQGNSNPRYLRATVDKMPVSKDLAETSKLPLGLVVQPLAKPRKDEVPLQVVDHGADGPVRCTRCRAYISPWCTFVQGGAKFICGICSHSNEVPEWYFSNVDMSGRRLDHDQRPELRYGSVEFEVPADYYSSRKPAPLSYVFAIDVSAQAVKSGLVEASCEALKETLYGKDAAESNRLERGNKIGLITFDKSVHFYNLAPALTQAQMLVVPDINDMFIPLQDGFLVDPEESKDIILDLLQNLPAMFRDTIRPEAVFSSAVRGGMLALKNTGGNLFVFQSTLPNYGAHALKARDDKALYNTDKEKQLLHPQNDAYKELAKECIKNGVCVHTWLFPAQYTDVATLGAISSLTGGDVRYYPNFSIRDTAKVIFQLNHDVHRESGFDGVLRIRCSDGLQVIDHYGNCNMSTYTDMELAGIDEDKAITAVLKHDSKLDMGRGVVFQCALLYTTRSGHRRVRVHNLSLAVSNQIADIFRSGDEDATISILLRRAIFDSYHKNRRDIHQKLTEQCVQILTAYRLNCAASTSAGQLILPEAFKLLPIYIHACMRSHALRGVGADMQIDLRSSGMYLLNSLGVKELVLTLYPRLFGVHNMDDECGVADLGGQVKLPPMVRTSYERLDSKGAYLLDTGSDLYFWLGNRIGSEFLRDVFGVERLDQVDPNMTILPFLDTPLSQRINDIATRLQSDRARYLQLRIVRQEMDAIEFVFSTWMAEDRNAEVQTYVDYMCVLHRKIQDEMKRLNN